VTRARFGGPSPSLASRLMQRSPQRRTACSRSARGWRSATHFCARRSTVQRRRRSAVPRIEHWRPPLIPKSTLIVAPGIGPTPRSLRTRTWPPSLSGRPGERGLAAVSRRRLHSCSARSR
jgi:hypothetical protein